MFFYSEQSGPVDPYAANVSLLLKGDGANNSTSIIDSSANNFSVTANGNARISTDQSKFGGSSLYFDGNSDFLSLPTNSAFNFGSGDFTIEFWYKKSGQPQDYARIFQTRSGDVTAGVSIAFEGRTDNLKAWFSPADGYFTGAPMLVGVASNSEWRHFAIVRQGNTVSSYQNGTLVSSDTLNVSLYYNAYDTIIIGGQTGGRSVNGYIDDLRVTKGVARYTATFTPPGAL